MIYIHLTPISIAIQVPVHEDCSPSASVAKTIDQNTNPAIFLDCEHIVNSPQFFLEHKKTPRRHLLIALQDSKLTAIKGNAITIPQEEESSRAQSDEDGCTKPNHMCQRKLINSNQSKYHFNTKASESLTIVFTFCVLCLHSVFIFVALLNDAEEKGVV